MDCPQFDNGAERLVIVDVDLLGEAPDDPACLLPSQGAVRVEHVLVQPLASDNVSTWQSRHKARGVVLDESLVLLRHLQHANWG